MMLPRGLGRVAIRAVDSCRSRIALSGAMSLGPGVRVFGWPRVSCQGELDIEAGVVFVSSPSPIQLIVGPDARLVIGAGTVIESGAIVRAQRGIYIGNEARVGAGCVIDDGDPVAAEIEVCDRAWLEDGAVVPAGARIAAGSIVQGRAAADAPASSVRFIARDEATRSIEDRIRGAIGRVLPNAAQVESGDDLRLFKEWDSLAALRVLVAIEREFAVTLPHDLLVNEPRLDRVTAVLRAAMLHREVR